MKAVSFEIRDKYGEFVSEEATYEEARSYAKSVAEDYAADETYDEPFTVVMCVPLEVYVVKRPEPNPVVCECVTITTCVVG